MSAVAKEQALPVLSNANRTVLLRYCAQCLPKHQWKTFLCSHVEYHEPNVESYGC